MIQDGICLDDLDVNNFPSLTALSLTVSLLDAYWIVRSWHCVTPGIPWASLAWLRVGPEPRQPQMASNTNRHRFKDSTRNDAGSNIWTRNVDESGSKQTQYMMYMCTFMKTKMGSWQLTRTRFHQTIQKICGFDDAKTTGNSNKKNLSLSICSNRSFWQKSNPSAFWRLNVTEFLELLLRSGRWLHVVVYKPHKLNPQLGIWPRYLKFIFTFFCTHYLGCSWCYYWIFCHGVINSSQSWDNRIC